MSRRDAVRLSRVCRKGDGCRELRQHIAGHLPECTKSSALCLRVDPRIAELRSGLTLEEFDATGREVLVGHHRARVWISQQDTRNWDDHEWRDGILELHRQLFEYGLPVHAGKLRTARVQYGHGVGRHLREGVAPHLISDALTRVCANHLSAGVTQSLTTRRGYCQWAARLLRAFFHVHPFIDGNGRVVRLVVNAVGMDRIGSVIGEPFSSRRRKWYRECLQFAHRHHEESDDAIAHGRMWWGPLARWVDKSLVEVVESEPSTPPAGSDVGVGSPQGE